MKNHEANGFSDVHSMSSVELRMRGTGDRSRAAPRYRAVRFREPGADYFGNRVVRASKRTAGKPARLLSATDRKTFRRIAIRADAGNPIGAADAASVAAGAA